MKASDQLKTLDEKSRTIGLGFDDEQRLINRVKRLTEALAQRPQLNSQEFEKLRIVSSFVHEYDTWETIARKALEDET